MDYRWTTDDFFCDFLSKLGREMSDWSAALGSASCCSCCSCCSAFPPTFLVLQRARFVVNFSADKKRVTSILKNAFYDVGHVLFSRPGSRHHPAGLCSGVGGDEGEAGAERPSSVSDRRERLHHAAGVETPRPAGQRRRLRLLLQERALVRRLPASWLPRAGAARASGDGGRRRFHRSEERRRQRHGNVRMSCCNQPDGTQRDNLL